MRTIERTVEIRRPLRAVYDQWTRFQDFPHFMEGITEVRLTDEKQLYWEAEIGGKIKRWNAEIVEQLRDQCISWRSTSGAENWGTVIFISLTPSRTQIILYLGYYPKGVLEHLGASLGLVSARVAADLNRFREFIESRGAPVQSGPIAEATVPVAPATMLATHRLHQWKLNQRTNTYETQSQP